MDAFKNGERIVHPVFGTGTVLNIEEKGSLKIAFDTVGEKRIGPRYAGLTRLTPAEESLKKREIEPPEVGEDIEGSLWLQGYLWYPEPV